MTPNWKHHRAWTRYWKTCTDDRNGRVMNERDKGDSTPFQVSIIAVIQVSRGLTKMYEFALRAEVFQIASSGIPLKSTQDFGVTNDKSIGT